ncbi:MAG: hypothetical protein A2622_04945 [Bdellovibrionales bacterium RIFCSPHIGHO2_01_FULL_40_29]|nr:MAG: hypothetical protein A2622_04945 [Bdellovibrionales bacterium RIFCSPHIGHO2_01_FULL_40_29]OFZ34722.1 MAG: hypothetical protein A3D17_10425 [Bdellovibrionales bacterium RIFCSPHIGHO2_02_FULL_40_15]
MKTTILIIGIMIVLLAQSLWAEPTRLSIANEVQYFYLNPKNSSPFFSKLEIKLYGSAELSDALDFKYNTTLNYVHLSQQDQKQMLINPTEFGFFGSASIFDYQLGFWQYTPEGPDINNLFNVIHGKDYRQPFSSENLSSLGLLVSATYEILTFKAFYIPKNSKSILPDTQSPWWPRTDTLPISNSSGTFYLPDQVNYRFRNESEVQSPFLNNWGGSAKLAFNNFDINLFYYSGANQTPQIYPNFTIDITTSIDPPVGVIRPDVDLDTTWIKSDHAGAGLSTVLDPVIAKVFCKKQTDYGLPQSSSTSCTGSLESSLDIFSKSLRFFIQTNRQWKSSSSISELETLLGFFEKSTALGYLIDLNSENIVSGAFVYNEKSPSLLTSVRYERRWTDQFKSILGINIITAQDQPLAKSYDQTDSATFKINYDF